MGYLITAHVFRDKPDVSRLAELPKSIGYRVYLHRTANLYLLDNIRPAKPSQYPFQTLLPTVDIPLELPAGLESLERLYSWLGPLNLANGFKKSYINVSLLLNRLLQIPVFSFASNDDELDFTCSTANGTLSRLKCRCGDLVISYDNKSVQVIPLVPEDVENDDILTDTAALNSAMLDVEVLPREMAWNTDLHWIAIEELQAFTTIKETILGLGSFDPPEDESEWQLIASR